MRTVTAGGGLRLAFGFRNFKIGRLCSVAAVLGVSLSVLATSPIEGQTVDCSPDVTWTALGDVDGSGSPTCTPGSLTLYCKKPKFGGFLGDLQDPECDPRKTMCDVNVSVTVTFPDNDQNYPFPQNDPVPLITTEIGSPSNQCGLDEEVVDYPAFYVEQGRIDFVVEDFTCAMPPTTVLTARACPGQEPFCSEENTQFDLGKALEAQFCGEPPKHDCECNTCKIPGGAGGGGNVGGEGPSASPPGSGPKVLLHYRAGGVGAPGLPGSDADWAEQLGRHWTHDGERRIVVDTDVANNDHVWLITRLGSFREFSTKDGGGVYTVVSPSNEYRTLTDTGSGWTLEELDGTVHTFDGDGRWVETEDRFGNETLGQRDAQGRLMTLTKPDGLSETFHYDPTTGKLDEIRQIGVDGMETRSWFYDWTGDDLTEIERPDGTKWKFLYASNGLGWLTHMILVSNPPTGTPKERVEYAFEYDNFGNVVRGWKGAMDFANGVETWEYQFDDPLLPTQTTVIDPKGMSQTYFIDRPDTTSDVPFVTEVTGACPGCGIEPGTVFTPGSNTHDSLKIVQETDSDGTVTELTYDTNGMLTQRIDDLGGSEERMTGWSYHPDFPALVETVTRDSVRDGFSSTTTYTYDPTGYELTQRQEQGQEQDIEGNWGLGYDLTTVITPDPSGTGSPQVVDPPGYGTSDQTSYTYDPNRGPNGGLVPTSRTDPLIGTTHFEHDEFNRRSATVDPNGIRTEVEYDALDRVTFTRVCNVGGSPTTTCAASGGPTLVTENQYDEFGDLAVTIRPEGNRVVYGYEEETGRLEEIQRQPAAATNEERTYYEYDEAGNRTLESHERWDGGAWVREAATTWEYDTRCQVDRRVEAPGTADEAVTEYGYGCDGNLEHVWDAEHLNDVTPTTSYTYDALDRLETVITPWGADPQQDVVVTYDYDVRDHLIAVTDGEGNVTSYEYSDRDLLTAEVSPVSGVTRHAYNDHGELEQTVDARSIETTHQIDELDRRTRTEVAESVGGNVIPAMTVELEYDDPLVPNSLGRVTRITKDRTEVTYAYDQFGRTTEDGELSFTHDDNGNVVTTTYPDGTVATHGYDHADRPVTLDVTPGGGSQESVISDTVYLPAGPIERMDFASGLSESRDYTQRYAVDRLRLGPTASFPSGSLLDWDYTVDLVGNVELIEDAGPNPDRAFGYQDYQYYLTDASGPWVGPLSWQYDMIGNRKSETRGTTTDSYSYEAGASGNKALLDAITLGGGAGTRTYDFGAAGHLEEVDSVGNVIDFGIDGAGRLSGIERANDLVFFRYDGRGYLRTAGDDLLFADGFESGDFACWSDVSPGTITGTCPGSVPSIDTTTATYHSSGMLYALERASSTTATEVVNYFYFGSRPVAQLGSTGGVYSDVETITTDHLGTPVLLADGSATVQWFGGFEPFGEDWQAGMAGAAGANGMYLRLPGQWEDEVWEDAASAAGLYQNVYRWYEAATGRFAKSDPIGLQGGSNLFAYVAANPLKWLDPLGLCKVCCEKSPVELFEAAERAADVADQLVRTGGFTTREGGCGPVAATFCDEGRSPSTGFFPCFFDLGPCEQECTKVHEGAHGWACRQFGMVTSDAGWATEEAFAYQSQALCLATASKEGCIDGNEEFPEMAPLPVP